MRRLIVALMMVLLPVLAQATPNPTPLANILFEDNFDTTEDWRSQQQLGGTTLAYPQTNWQTCTTYCPPDKGVAPYGWAGYRASRSYFTSPVAYPNPYVAPDGVTTPATQRDTFVIDSENAYGGSGKSVKYNVEQYNGWTAGSLYIWLGQNGYSELYIRYKIQYAPEWKWSDPANTYHAYQKMIRAVSFKGNINDPIPSENDPSNTQTGTCNQRLWWIPDWYYNKSEPDTSPQMKPFAVTSSLYVDETFNCNNYPTPPSEFGAKWPSDGEWHTYEFYIKLNTPGVANGHWRMHIDGQTTSPGYAGANNIMWLEAGDSATPAWNFIQIFDNLQMQAFPPATNPEQQMRFDDVVVYQPISAGHPLWASSPQDGRLPLSYTIGGGNTYYVSTTGSDSNNGTSPSTPWQTIAKVNSVSFEAGDTIRFASGDYGTTTLSPATSGSAGGLITFTSYVGAATKPVLRGGVNLNGRSYVKIDGLDVTSNSITFSLSGATYNTISNSTIYSTAAYWSPTISVRNGSHYNTIKGNTIGQVSANNDIINLRNDADNNLIENNDITIQGSHAAIDIEGWTLGGEAAVGDRSGNNNIIRNNRITGHNGAGTQITIQANSYGNVVDDNVLKGDSTVGDFCHLTFPANQYARTLALIKGVGERNIIRNNVLSNYPCQDSEGIFMDTYVYDGFTNNAINNRIYNNVVTGIGSGATGLYFGVANGGTHSGNVVKNNIFLNNGGSVWTRDADGAVAAETALFQMRESLDSNYYDNNIFFTTQTGGAVIWLGSSYYTVTQADSASTKWAGNLQVDPQLNTSTFLPNTGSPALNAGVNLPTITSASGSGPSFTVADAYYFTDGNGITTGDVIKVGTQTTTITDITYGAGTTGTLTVSPAITWMQGTAVNLPFTGTSPHIGLSRAAGVVGTTPPPPSSSTPRIRASFRAAVR